jgi:Amt family ammonium transporter
MGGGFIGNPASYFMFQNVLDAPAFGTIPLVLFAFFQLKFAIITPALITGTFAERIRFKSYIIFIVLFSLLIYAPLAHWTWHADGFLYKMGVLDFAGGTVVHMSAGFAALAASMYLRNKNEVKTHISPANIPFVLLGTGLLWFGWFGFNAGSALAANGIAALAFTTTMLAPAGTLVVWTLLDLIRVRQITAVGAGTAIVVGLVAITPAAGFVGPMSAIALGGLAALPSYFVILLRARTGLDDSLDVVAAHGVGGTVGALLTGVFAQKALNGVADGLLFGNPGQFVTQVIAVLAAAVFSAVVSGVLLKAIGAVMPLRADDPDQATGMDLSMHGEEAYVHTGGMGSHEAVA